MRPLKLTIKNIAAFIGEHIIDFSVLGDMFLICGKTGAGKTTILDAITYSLYGSLPGARKQNDIRRLRSDFCAPQDESSVQFEFLLNGKTYRTDRTLPISRLRRSGTLTEDGETAALYLLSENKADQLSCQKTETDILIKSLLCLSAEEFSRIVLLPQGDFAEFLRQKSSERKEMLSKLFPVERFTLSAERLKNEKNRLANMLEEVMTNLDRLAKIFFAETAEQQKLNYEQGLAEAVEQSENLRSNIFTAKTEFAQLEKKLKAYREYELIQKSLDELLAKADEHAALSLHLQHIKAALALEPLLMRSETIDKKLRQTIADLAECEKKLKNCDETLSILEKQKDIHLQNEKRIAEIALQMQNMEHAQKTAEELANTQAVTKKLVYDLASCRSKIEKITKQLEPLKNTRETGAGLANQSQKMQQELLRAEYFCLRSEDAELAKTECELQNTAQNAQLILEDFLNRQENEQRAIPAFFLAQTLQTGSACPVCGSTEHPYPAAEVQETLDLIEKIRTQRHLSEQARALFLQTQDRRKELKGRIAQSLTNLGTEKDQANFDLPTEQNTEKILSSVDALKNKQMIQQEFAKLKEQLADWESAGLLIQGLETELEPIKKAENLFCRDIAVIQAQEKQSLRLLEQLLHKAGNLNIPVQDATASLERILNNLHSERHSLAAAGETYIKKTASAEKENAILNGQKTVLSLNLQELEAEARKTETELRQALEDSPFKNEGITGTDSESIEGSLQEVQNALAHKNETDRLETEIEQYKTEKQGLEILCGEKKAALCGNPEQLSTEREAILQRTADLEKSLEQAENTRAEIQRQLSELSTLSTEYKNFENRRRLLVTELELYAKLSDAISGKNPKKIPLDAWVLRMYLEEVTLCAGRRLERISDGRYTMHLKDSEGGRGYQGLDLEIYDGYTGKKRPCSTLSGGETFMAAISLALAVSDTVQAQSGGIQLDSLFIDEGFGTLDEASLEKALSVLDEIRGNRCIGLVSHVDSLKTRLPARLEIQKSLTGSSIQTVFD